MIDHRRTALGCASLLLTAGTLAAVGSGASAQPQKSEAATAAHLASAPQAECKYRGFNGSGSLVTAWKGGSPHKIGGGRSLGLRTGRDSIFINGDRSSAKLINAKKGDSAWVEIRHQEHRPESWRKGVACGITAERHPSATVPGAPKRYYIQTRWYFHSSPTLDDRWMRACAETRGDVKCGKWYDDHV
ncbi:hypothetical protein [Streptomyces atriruber]|uniref:hypothetical protein n=1 Tax=Streptomyces atriruber TaxID=545121 RepID=UPI0006E12577|nr:hypothetical protein [Streptomyces atriruber]